MMKCSSIEFQFLPGLQSLAESRRYKAWFLDQFGVLHDGKQPYPGAISTCSLLSFYFIFSWSVYFCILHFKKLLLGFLAVEKLAGNGAKMVVISNSSRRATATLDKLKSLGFDPSLFAGAITSGELTHQYLQRRDDAWFASLGRSCIHITWNERGAISLEGLHLQVVDSVAEAEFILVHGTEAIGQSSGTVRPMELQGLEKILEAGAAKNIPMVVANPDYVTVEARALRIMPGTLADKYEKLGGEVKWMGKPDKIIYKEAMAMAGVDAGESIAVGDSLHHDIKGASEAGIDSVFITCGIHATELGLGNFGEVADLSAVETIVTKYGALPSYVVPSFTW